MGLGSLLVHTSLTKPKPNTSHLSGYSSPCKSGPRCRLCPSMGNTNSVTNHLQTKLLTLQEENVIPNIPFMLQNVQSTIYFTLVRVLRN